MTELELVIRRLDHLHWTPTKIKYWLTNPNYLLGLSTPLELLNTNLGYKVFEAVERVYLDGTDSH